MQAFFSVGRQSSTPSALRNHKDYIKFTKQPSATRNAFKPKVAKFTGLNARPGRSRVNLKQDRLGLKPKSKDQQRIKPLSKRQVGRKRRKETVGDALNMTAPINIIENTKSKPKHHQRYEEFQRKVRSSSSGNTHA